MGSRHWIRIDKYFDFGLDHGAEIRGLAHVSVPHKRGYLFDSELFFGLELVPAPLYFNGHDGAIGLGLVGINNNIGRSMRIIRLDLQMQSGFGRDLDLRDELEDGFGLRLVQNLADEAFH